MNLVESLVSILGGTMPSVGLNTLPWIIVTMVLASVMCFAGYRLLRVFIALCGLGLGAVIGAVAGSYLKAGNTLTLILIALFAAGICLVSFLIYKAGIFLAAFFVFWALAYQVLKHFSLPISMHLIAVLIGILMGILAVIFLKPIVIVSSAISGGMTLSAALFENILHMSGFAVSVVMLLVGIFVGALGIVVQYKITGKYKKRK